LTIGMFIDFEPRYSLFLNAVAIQPNCSDTGSVEQQLCNHNSKNMCNGHHSGYCEHTVQLLSLQVVGISLSSQC